MSGLTVLFVVLAVVLTVPVYAFAVRRLLGLRLSPVRAWIGGLIALACASPIITAIGSSIAKRSHAVGERTRCRPSNVRSSGPKTGPSRGLTGAEQRELVGPRQAFDACLLAARGGAVGHPYRICQLDWQPACRVPTRGAGSMARESALEIDRPTRIQRAVVAAQQIYPRLGHQP